MKSFCGRGVMITMKSANDGDFVEQRRRLIQRIEREGIADRQVLDAMAVVPREEFVPDELRRYAYRDGPLPIGHGQTISQPSMVAMMVEALELAPTDRVLEVGGGSGYAAAVMGRIAREVYSIERFADLAQLAADRMLRLGIENVEVRHGDGTQGLTDAAPFDAICVSAGGSEPPTALLKQLRVGGRLVMPLGASADEQKLVRVRKVGERDFRVEELADVRFVPLVSGE